MANLTRIECRTFSIEVLEHVCVPKTKLIILFKNRKKVTQ